MPEPITIVTGSPGTGKTTLSRWLAARAELGLHLETDLFYRFPAHPIDPSLPQSRAQNHAIVTAFSRAAAAFAEAGYRVYLDGIVGPWFLPVVCGELQPRGLDVDYVVLAAPLDEVLARVAGRSQYASPRVVAQMHESLADLGDLQGHRLDATRPVEAVGDEVLRAGSRFRLPPTP